MNLLRRRGVVTTVNSLLLAPAIMLNVGCTYSAVKKPEWSDVKRLSHVRVVLRDSTVLTGTYDQIMGRPENDAVSRARDDRPISNTPYSPMLLLTNTDWRQADSVRFSKRSAVFDSTFIPLDEISQLQKQKTTTEAKVGLIVLSVALLVISVATAEWEFSAE